MLQIYKTYFINAIIFIGNLKFNGSFNPQMANSLPPSVCNRQEDLIQTGL